MLDQKYRSLLCDIYTLGDDVVTRGELRRELLGCRFSLDDISDNIIRLPGFETRIDFAKAELEWYYSGDPRISHSPLIEKVWKKYSDDGETASNYGARIFGKHRLIGADQWSAAKEALRGDAGSTRAVLNIHSYFDPKSHEKKDVPCTLALQLFQREGKLDMVAYMRSNDAVLGFRNDLYCFTEMQKRMAAELGMAAGRYVHFAGSMHIYERHFGKVEALLP